MTDTRHELDERLLREARQRAQGRLFRRVLGLIAFAFLVAAIGFGRADQQPLAFVVAGVLVVAAVVVAWRGER